MTSGYHIGQLNSNLLHWLLIISSPRWRKSWKPHCPEYRLSPKLPFAIKSLSLPSTVLRTVYFLTLEVKVFFCKILVFRGHGGEGESHVTAQNQGQNLGISVLLNKIFQLVLLFSSPSEGAGTQTAGFFQDPLGETVFFGSLCYKFTFQLSLGF